MRRDTYKVLTSYIKNEKKNCQKIVLRKPFFFTTMIFGLTTNVLTVFRLTVNRLRDIRDPPYGTLGRNSAGS